MPPIDPPTTAAVEIQGLYADFATMADRVERLGREAWRHAADGKPFLGICRGCQLMNVALGGTLYTHIPAQLPGALDHSYPGKLRTVLVHPVKIEEGTHMAEVFGEPLIHVNSLHHQGLKDIAPSVRVTGVAPDGLVEAIELPDHPFGLAVQWHPEWLTDQAGTRNLFRKFVEAAEK